MKKIIMSLILISLFRLSIPCCAFEGKTHAKINKYIAENTLDQFSINTFLINILGFQKGVKESIQSKYIWQWLEEGGEKEDSPIARALNHFHNPLNNEGLIAINKSLIIWSQLPIGEQAEQFWAKGSWKAPYSWHDTRQYFYNALISQDKNIQDINFVKTFRGLGQLMHLVQDSSVPLHTRDDIHILPDYEKWVAGRNKDREANVNIDSMTPMFFDYSMINESNSIAPVPIANLVDTDKYVWPEPDPSVTLVSDIGLAEYSNANFLSDDTIFSGFPYPKMSESIFYIENGRWYIAGNGSGEYVKHLARLSSLSILRSAFFPWDYTRYPAKIDKVCYGDYASFLVPRAIGYSSQLLKYFFRGRIEISSPEGSVYSLIDGALSPQQFTYIEAKLRNVTPIETNDDGQVISYDQMGSGTLLAVAKYKERTDYQEDLSTDPPDSSSRADNFSYSVSAPIEISSLDSANGMEFTFDFSSNPIPVGITDLYLQVIFKGTLGNETDDAIAVGMKDLSEPMQITIWNSTDMFYLDGVLKKATDISSDSYLRNRVDLDNDGNLNETAIGEPYIEPYNIDTEISFYALDSAPSTVNVYYSQLPYGEYGRLIFLSDDRFNIRINRKAVYPPTNDEMDYTLSGVVNQGTSEDVFENTYVSTFRGIRQHNWHSYAGYYPFITGISTAPWPEVTDGPVSTTTINP